MIDNARRKELVANYKQTHPEAGIYRIVNTRTNRALLGSSTNLEGMRNKMKFARSTNSPGALDYRLRNDIKEYGLDSFDLEALDVLDIRPEMTDREIRDDLAALESIWREQLGGSSHY
jgi:hypothetical protein